MSTETYTATLFDCETTNPEFLGVLTFEWPEDQAKVIRGYLEDKGQQVTGSMYLVVGHTGAHYLTFTAKGYQRYTLDSVRVSDVDGATHYELLA